MDARILEAGAASGLARETGTASPPSDTSPVGNLTRRRRTALNLELPGVPSCARFNSSERSWIHLGRISNLV